MSARPSVSSSSSRSPTPHPSTKRTRRRATRRPSSSLRPPDFVEPIRLKRPARPPDFIEPHVGSARGADIQDARARPCVRLKRRVGPPDFIEPLVGWRAWRVLRDGNGLALGSVVFDDVWPARRAFIAGCEQPHAAPAARCLCGVHAARRRSDIRRYLVGRLDASTVAFVAGEVSMWGTLVECESGWRAERAYPRRLWIPPERPELAEALDRYGVPIACARRRLLRGWPAHKGDHHDQGGDAVDDPRDNVPDELDDRLDNLSATLTDDEMTTSSDTRTTGVIGDADDADADDADADDADDTGV